MEKETLRLLCESENYVLPILIHGNDDLKIIAQKTPDDMEVVNMVSKALLDTLTTTDKGVGLAATQIGIPYRAFVVWEDRLTGGKPKFFINPEMIDMKGSKVTGFEGCLSVPGIYARVERFQKVRLSYMDEDGNKHIKQFKNFDSTVIQHEYDHLSGIEFYEKINKEELRKIQKDLDDLYCGKAKIDVKYKIKLNNKYHD